jgi:Na+/proline symporter
MTVLEATMAGIALTVGISVYVSFGAVKGPTTLLAYYWADRSLSQNQSAHLFTANSFSLNGLMYHTYLGYTVGIYSSVIQLFWCASFLILAYHADNISRLAMRDTLHGNISRIYGHRAGVAASIASLIGFASLAGWELVVGTKLFGDLLSIPLTYSIPFSLLIAFVAVAYTVRGGLRGNAKANVAQNFIGLAALVLLFAGVIYAAGTSLPRTEAGALNYSKIVKWDFELAWVALGGIALLANAYFSLLWQAADMSTWQNISGLQDSGKNTRWAFIKGAAGTLLMPGLIGTLIGMGLSGKTGITSDNVLNVAVDIVSQYSTVLVLITVAGLVAAMLSTLDGLFLAAANTLTWDISHQQQVRSIIGKEIGQQPLDETEKDVEARILSISHLVIVAIAMVATIIVSLLNANIQLFHLLYFIIIGQMSIVPVSFAVMRNTVDQPSAKSGVASVLAGLISGFGTFVYGLVFLDPKVAQSIMTWIPVIVTVIATVALWAVPRHASITQAGAAQ